MSVAQPTSSPARAPVAVIFVPRIKCPSCDAPYRRGGKVRKRSSRENGDGSETIYMACACGVKFIVIAGEICCE
jgi:hypothetical protein